MGRLSVCRPSGAPFCLLIGSHHFRGGLRCFVPDGTGGIGTWLTKDVFRVVGDAVFAEERPKPFLESDLAMLRFLILDVTDDLIEVRCTDAESSVPFLPGKAFSLIAYLSVSRKSEGEQFGQNGKSNTYCLPSRNCPATAIKSKREARRPTKLGTLVGRGSPTNQEISCARITCCPPSHCAPLLCLS
jgi:hypothetical protein